MLQEHPMFTEHEADLRILLAEGIVARDEAESLQAEARRRARSPLELLAEQGRISGDTLARLRMELPRPDALARGAQGEASTVAEHPARQKSSAHDAAFPVGYWDRYECLRFLGQGGMGRVFLAYDPRLRRNVAIKFMRDDDPELARRFVSEARAQARVSHAHVCEVYEVGEVRGKPYIAMQYVDGRSLGELVHELTVEQKAMLLRDVAEGVHEAHRAGLIHRDIKSSNILVERTEAGRWKPYIVDFGLARDWRESTTMTGTVLGTPGYMAPEQARGETGKLDRRADVYGLGATLYHLLTGQPPIPGHNGLEVLNNIASVEPRPARVVDPDIPADLEAIAMKCLEKERSLRYDSARVLAEDLGRYLDGEPVHARPAGPWYRLRKKARKHRLLLGVAGIALVLVALALGWAGMTRREAGRREQLARHFAEKVEHIEAMARYAYLSPLHDTGPDRDMLRARMAELEADMQRAGSLAVGPGQYALGRGFLALGDEHAARAHLEIAWQRGSREPRVAYALALVMGRLYQEGLLEAERIRSAELREARKQELARLYREPALAYLHRSRGAAVPSTDHVSALIAFHEGRHQDALAHLDAMGGRLPWFFEAPKLRGDILVARAGARSNQGDRDGALADLAEARRAYQAAAAIGESDPAVHHAMAELEYTSMIMELYGAGDIVSHLTRGMEAVSRTLVAAPRHYKARVLEARFHRRLAEHQMNSSGDVESTLTRAVQAATLALELEPGLPDARLELARTWRQWARYKQERSLDPRPELGRAVEAFESIAARDRDYEFHANLGLVFQVWADYEEQHGEDSLGKRGKAIDAYLAAIALSERVPDAWISLGTAHFKRASHARAEDPDGDLTRAVAALHEAIARGPDNYVPHFYLGRVYELKAQRSRNRGQDAGPDLRGALQSYQAALAINARIPQLHNGLGNVFLEQAREAWEHGESPDALLDQALAAYERAAAVAPRQGFAYNNIGEIHATRASYQRALGKDPRPGVREAERAYRQAIERLPGHSVPWANLAKIHCTQAAFELGQGTDPGGSLDAAAQAIAEALARNPDDAAAWRYRGEMQALRARWQGRQGAQAAQGFEEAERSFQKSLELAPDRREYRVALGYSYWQWAAWQEESGGDPGPVLQRGLDLAGELLAARPHDADARLLRALLLDVRAGATASRQDKEGLLAEAQADARAALSQNPHLEHEWRDRVRMIEQRPGLRN